MTSTNDLTKSRTRYHIVKYPLFKGFFYFYTVQCLNYVLIFLNSAFSVVFFLQFSLVKFMEGMERGTYF